MCVPERFALLSNEDRVSKLQVHHRVESSQPEGNVVKVGQSLSQRQFGGRTVTGFTTHIFNAILIGMDIAIAHRLHARMAVHTVEGILASGEDANGLVIIIDPLGGLASSFDESHCT